MNEPIAVADALRLIELALADCDKATPGSWLHRGEGIDAVIWETTEIAVACTYRPDTSTAIANAAFIVLARATMRPLMGWLGWSLRGIDESREIHHTAANYPPLAALRDHYDAVRPGWRTE